jgi:hypothetical protein
LSTPLVGIYWKLHIYDFNLKRIELRVTQ